MTLSKEEIEEIEEEERIRAEARLKYSRKKEKLPTSSITKVIGVILVILLILSIYFKQPLVLFFAFIPIVYFIPAIIGYEKQKENAQAILLLNLFLGWTFIGWIIALVWAHTKD